MIERIPDLRKFRRQSLVRGAGALSTTFSWRSATRVTSSKSSRAASSPITPGPFITPNYSFALRAPRDEWEMFWKKVPAPGHNDIFALFKRGKLTIEGDCTRSWRTCSTSRTCWPLPRRGHSESGDAVLKKGNGARASSR